MWWKWFVLKVISIKFVITLIFYLNYYACTCDSTCLVKVLFKLYSVLYTPSKKKEKKKEKPLTCNALYKKKKKGGGGGGESGGLRFFSSEFKLKINKWCLHPRCLYYMYLLL